MLFRFPCYLYIGYHIQLQHTLELRRRLQQRAEGGAGGDFSEVGADGEILLGGEEDEDIADSALHNSLRPRMCIFPL